MLDAAKLVVSGKGPPTFSEESPISTLSQVLGLFEDQDRKGIAVARPDLLRVLNPPPNCSAGVASLRGLLALDMRKDEVTAALWFLRQRPPEIELLDRALSTLCEEYHSNTRRNLEALAGQSDAKAAQKIYRKERKTEFARFMELVQNYKAELVAMSNAVNLPTRSMYATCKSPLATEEGRRVRFPPAASFEPSTAFLQPDTQPGTQRTTSQDGQQQEHQQQNWVFWEHQQQNWVFWEEQPPAAQCTPSEQDENFFEDLQDNQEQQQRNKQDQQSDVQPESSDLGNQANVHQLVLSTREILLQMAATMIDSFSGQGIRTAKDQRGRRAGTVAHPVWPQVKKLLRQARVQGTHTGLAEKLLIFHLHIWQEAVEAAPRAARAGILFQKSKLDSIAKGCALLAELDAPRLPLEAFAHALVRVLMSQQWKATSAAVVFKRSLSSDHAEKVRQIQLFVRCTVCWFIALYDPHCTTLVFPVLGASEKSLFLNRKHFWKFEMDCK